MRAKLVWGLFVMLSGLFACAPRACPPCPPCVNKAAEASSSPQPSSQPEVEASHARQYVAPSGLNSHEECRRQPSCQDCLRAPLRSGQSSCVVSRLVVRNEYALDVRRYGLNGRLELLTDARWTRPEGEDYRGYLSDDIQPMAASVIRLTIDTDSRIEQEELHPAVSIEQKNLGDGTDTYVATEEIACSAGRYCGWTSLFYQIRDGHLLRLSALDKVGEHVVVHLTQADAVSWWYEPTTSDGPVDILHRRYDFDDEGEIHRLTRFYFWNGTWMLVEDSIRPLPGARELSAPRPMNHRVAP
jgi:hypothetical protein